MDFHRNDIVDCIRGNVLQAATWGDLVLPSQARDAAAAS